MGALLAIHLAGLLGWERDLSFLDPVAALVVSFFIIKTGWTLGWQATANLIDQSLSPDELSLIEEHIKEYAPRIKGYRRLRTRRAGPFQLVEVDLLVDGDLSVSEAHALGVKVVMAIREHYPKADITFHLEPVDHEGHITESGEKETRGPGEAPEPETP
jgi:divalent metal cation (Fe/Co/Zn/Cd) transporter